MALFAEGILKLHWDQSVPVNLARIAKKMGIVVALSDSLVPCVCLDISASNQARITINTQRPVIHQRYAVAQALGHRALHHVRPGMERLIEVPENFAVDHSQRLTSEAHQFALALLIPAAVLQYSVRDMRLGQLHELAHLFQVPPLLVKQRLADLDLQLARPLALQVNRLLLE
ncbi:MAG: ImmA/IrrE family metallo-endopeptidase [Simplicispira sp.]|nr:ImmA/IrrE family metallo-endopeptidase [Simplicispira sp.]